MTTRQTFIERVKKIVNGGNNSTRSRVSDAEIAHQATSSLSAILYANVIATNFKVDGDSIFDGMLIVRYDGDNAVPITERNNGESVAVMPIAPMLLPKGAGVYSVFPSGHPEKEYLPINSGLINTLRDHKILNPLGDTTYARMGNKVVIHSDVVGAGVTKLGMDLCAFDIDHYGDFEPLPISAEMEESAIINICKIFGIEVPTERADSKTASPTKAETK